MQRRSITGFKAVALASALLALTANAAPIAAPIDGPTGGNVLDISSRRELFVDRYLIDRLDNATLKLHEPQLAPAMTEPADNLEYGTVIKDGELFRLYTREGRGAKFDGDTPEVTRYCESRDGIHWTKPKLELFEIDGNKDNNVILHEAPFCHNFSPFLDRRPNVPPDERFKALAGTVKKQDSWRSCREMEFTGESYGPNQLSLIQRNTRSTRRTSRSGPRARIVMSATSDIS